LNNPKDGF